MKQLTIDSIAPAPEKAGCPHWTYDFKKDCGKCTVSGELKPDEGAENLFRCDFEYFNCPHYITEVTP